MLFTSPPLTESLCTSPAHFTVPPVGASYILNSTTLAPSAIAAPLASVRRPWKGRSFDSALDGETRSGTSEATMAPAAPAMMYGRVDLVFILNRDCSLTSYLFDLHAIRWGAAVRRHLVRRT